MSEQVIPFFPKTFPATVTLSGQNHTHQVTLNGPLTVLLGPNGTGKTHLLRAMQPQNFAGKRTRFISAGRIGMIEQYRSVYSTNWHSPRYDEASLGNWHEKERRHMFETLEGDYQTIAARLDIQLKIRERLRKLFKRDIRLNWENGQLKVNFVMESGGGSDYSASREASGLLHLVGLLAAIYDDEIGMLLLDEPEVSLHPQLQAFLLREIVSVAGEPGEKNKKIIVISTHSTEFLKVDSVSDLPNLIFTTDVKTAPIQIDPNAGELQNKKIAELISRMGQEHKLAFFARSPLLVEGPSDTIICAGLSNKLDIHIEAGGSQILPVVGKGQFPVVVKLLRLMGKTPLVLADADAFTDGNELANVFSNDLKANAEAAKLSHANVMKMYGTVHDDFTKLVESDWNSIEPLASQTYYWKAREQGVAEEVKAKRRASFSAIFANEITTLSESWQTMRHRVATVLDILEIAGCYILRKGTIESYFSQDQSSGDGKPAAAAEEVILFKAKTEHQVKEQYADVLRCLESASASEDISEADLIKETLLGIAAPAIARIRENTSPQDLNSFAKSMGYVAAELFDLQSQDGNLVIGLKSQILEISCFPMTINPSDDIVSKVSDAISAGKKKL